ncbi:MAG: hypothetical protein AB1490_00510 [Pseudomonadota bacterium]
MSASHQYAGQPIQKDVIAIRSDDDAAVARAMMDGADRIFQQQGFPSCL